MDKISVNTEMINNAAAITEGQRDPHRVKGTIGFAVHLVNAFFEFADKDKVVTIHGKPLPLLTSDADPGYMSICNGQIALNQAKLQRWDFEPSAPLASDIRLLMLNLRILDDANSAVNHALEIAKKAHDMSGRERIRAETPNKHVEFSRTGDELVRCQLIYMTWATGRPIKSFVPLSEDEILRLKREGRQKSSRPKSRAANGDSSPSELKIVSPPALS